MNKILIIALSLLSCIAYAQDSDSTRIRNQEKIEELKKRVSSLEEGKSSTVAKCEEENSRLKLVLKQYQDSVTRLNTLIASHKGSATASACLYYSLGAKTTNYRQGPQLELILNQLKADSNLKLKLVGHTDKSGEEQSNLALSKQRAEDLRAYLINKKNIPSEKIITEWRGSSDPAVKNAARISPDCRRVEVLLVP